MISENEIDAEIMLTLDPAILEQHGGYATCARNLWVSGRHSFLCVEADDEIGRWLPLYSNSGIGRSELSKDGRIGHQFWTDRKLYYHPQQVWYAKHSAVVAAAMGDLSTPATRNTASTSSMPNV